MDIMKVAGNTFCIDTGMTYIPFYKINDREIVMLDTGWGDGERAGIDALLEKNDFRVVGIICSHAHIDHIGNVSYLKNKYGCTVAMSAYEALICASTVNLKVYYSSLTLSDVAEHFGDMVCETDVMILDRQDSISVKGFEFEIIHTPGHSPGHICIVTPDNVAYLGDALISYEVMEGAKMPYAFILEEDLKSKKKLYELMCGKYIVAHKGIYDDITQIIADNMDFYENRAARVYDVIEGAMTMEDIMKSVIKKWRISVNSTYKYAVIEKMLRSYVEYLNETRMIELVMENGFLKYTKDTDKKGN
ncbi:Glyoxylase, beta-lactamase superfamily II [Peptoclostridium litorale DSM 5388]|uniref:Hydrolase n=1 Tax=Peptoclostridium litorale DSM 5388 TaxID=1121324 RepID=A0A069RIC1_PEPLI|nr:MBL fold metallo-hydrolase [Peptoclostridium litorale]KDR96538.1 hydrolase [Peptoclostridium litorale DSM 5388]SIN69406.1 Glyoxylase, beta-lactamase superfamily II [Peptoclostridium litorale DSM 5388]